MTELDNFDISDQYQKFKEKIKLQIFGPEKVVEEEEKVFEYEPINSIEELKDRILDSSQRTFRLDDFEKKCFRNLDFFYEKQPNDSFWSFYKKLIYSVHPRIEEERERAKKMSWEDLRKYRKEQLAKQAEFLYEKYRKQKYRQEEENEQKEEFGSDIFGESKKESTELDDETTKIYDIGHDFKWFKKVHYTNQAKIDYYDRDFDLVVYKDTAEDIDPAFATYPKHNIGIIDLFLYRLENYQLWQSTRLFSMGFLCTFPILVGMVLARQVPKNLGSGDVFKVLKSKMVYKGGFNSDMTRREAGLILNLKQNATKEEIRKSHRKLMISNHPDNGGSQYIAAKINEAKELMLKGDI